MKYAAISLALTIVLSTVALAQPISVGSEFQVNTSTMNWQWDSQAAAAADGSFVVVWTDGYTGAVGQDGSVSGIQGQRFNPDGTPNGSEFPVNSTTLGRQAFPDVAMNDAGRFVVVWAHYYYTYPVPASLQTAIMGQRYDSDGSPVGSEMTINTFTPSQVPGGLQELVNTPDVAMAPDSPFVVAWQVQGASPGDPASWHVRARRYDTDGAPQGDDFRVNTYTTGGQGNPSVEMDASGRFTVVYQDGYLNYAGLSRDGSATGQFGQQFNADGSFRGADFQVHTYTTGDQFQSAIAMDDSGNFIVTWTDGGLIAPRFDGQDGYGAGIFGQSFDSERAPVGAEFQVNANTTFNQMYSKVEFTGSFVVVWQSYVSAGNDNSYMSVQGRRFTNPPCPSTGDFQVNTYTPGAQYAPSIAGPYDGHFVVSWSDSNYPAAGQDGSLSGIFSQRYFIPDVFSEDFESGNASCMSSTSP